MFKKSMAAAGCLAVVAASWSYAATTWQLQTKLNTAGGKLQVRDKAYQTTAGTVAYNNFTTSALIPVTVYANPGYRITLVKKGAVAQTITDDQLFTTTVDKTGGTTQALQASFTANKYTINSSVAGSGAGTISPASATVSYGGAVQFSASPSSTSVLSSVSAGTVTDAVYGRPVNLPYSGPVKITLTNVQGGQTVTATYTSVSVSAGADKVVAVGAPTTLSGNVAAGDTIAWTLVTGPETVDTSTWNSATPSFTPTLAGTYVFKATEGLAGLTDTVEITSTADVTAFMKSSCDGCHNATTGVLPSLAFNKWSTSKHAAANITCVTCHTNGAMPTPVNTATVSAATFKVLNSSAGTLDANYCANCHTNVGHNLSAVNTCDACHNPHNPTTALAAFGSLHVGGGTVAAGPAGNAQYISKTATCADCHGTSNAAILTEWAESAHAQAVPAAGLTENAWNAGEGSNATCARCHSTTGFISNPSNTGTTTALLGTDNQEVLGCKACHTSVVDGSLRLNNVAYTLPYKINAADSANGSIPAVGASSVCIPCHAGRGNGSTITSATMPSRFSAHYLTAGGTVFNATGYHYAGQTYDTIGKHKTAGAAGNGPCVTCHMSITSAGKGHTFEAVAKVGGVITAINTASACASCHADMTPAKLEADKASFIAAREVLKNALQTIEGAYYNPATGKFYTDATFTTAKASLSSAGAVGAAYNYWLLEHSEGAAYVHNRGYALKLIQDSIEFLNTGAVTGTYAVAEVTAANAAFSHANTISNTACASCHGATIPTQATSATCASCHTSATPEIVAKVEASKHAPEVTTHTGACGRCHTTEGYLAMTAAVAAGTANFAVVPATLTYTGDSNVSCAACHDSHNGAIRNAPVQWAPKYDTDAAAPAVTEQFRMCTSCHNLVNDAAVPVASGLTVSGQATVAMQQHSKDWYRNIASTHYDLPTTGVGQASTVIEGYNVRYNKPTACTDCHGHELYTNTGGVISATPTAGTIHTDWAQSGHAGGLLNAKFTAFTTANPTRARNVTNAAAVMAVGVTGTSGPAWEHYDWDATSRQSCQRCHTATGASNYLTAVKAFNDAGAVGTVAYNAANNDFSHLKGWVTAKTSPQNEVLYCWGCHTSVEQGAVVQTGAMPADYKFEGGTANGTFPNVNSSNLCVACHGGRSGGMNVKARTDLVSGTAVSFTNSHYLAAAGTLFKSIGYEFAGRTYANSSSFKHDKLGTTALTGYTLGDSGPCVACHLGNKANGGVAKFDHKFKLGGFQGGTCGTGTVAGACHATMTQAELDTEKEDFELSLDVLNALLKDKGFTWGPASPYFAAADWTRNGTDDGKNMLGAAFNLNYLLHEPGAFAHNRYYTKRMIIDSIDFVYNGALESLTPYTRTGSTTTYYAGSDIEAAIDYAVGKTYADHNGVVQTFTAEQAAVVKTYLDADTVTAGMQRR